MSHPAVPAAEGFVSRAHNMPDDLKARLEASYEDLAERVERLAAAANDLPRTVETDADVGKIGDHVKLVAAAAKDAEAMRVAEKEPHLKAGREVDGFFKAFSERLNRMKTILENRVGDYLREKARREREERLEQARREREEAERRAREAAEAEAAARPVEADRRLDQAAEAENRAVMTERSAAKPAADLARTRSDTGGSLSTLATVYEFEIVDVEKIDLEAIRPFIAKDSLEKAVRAFVKVHKDSRTIRGVRIWKDEKTVIR